MSLKAMIWVMERAPIESPTEGMVLYALADRANDDGTAAWPSMQWIADRACCSRQTVRRHLRAMEERGLIYRGDQRHVDHLRQDKRPVVWNLNLGADRNAGVQSDTPTRAGYQIQPSGVPNPTERGTTRDTQTTHNPPEHTPLADDTPSEFDVFWASYPKRVNRTAAEKEWAAATAQAPATAIMAGLTAANQAWAHTEIRWIPNPATWLRDRRWEDHHQPGSRPKARRCHVCEDTNGFIELYREDGTPYVMKCQHDHSWGEAVVGSC